MMFNPFSSFVLPTIILQKIRDAQSNDFETARKRRGYFHAFVMLVCLTVLLAVIYYSQEPYRYIVSSKAFRGELHFTQLQEGEVGGELGRDEVWKWFDQVLGELGGESERSVQLNCAYADKKSQVVNINGVEYYLVDPANDITACQQLGYIDGAADKVFLAGVHQVLSFGAFSTRSRQTRPRSGSVVDSQQASLSVPESSASRLGTLTDDRVVQLCKLQGGQGDNGTYCIAEDAFSTSTGSTFGWRGQTVTIDDVTYFAFDEGSNATLFVDALHNYTTVFPCYSSDGDGGVTLTPDLSSFTSVGRAMPDMNTDMTCSTVWITSGRTVRDSCLLALGDQATPLQAYVAGLYNMQTVPELYEYQYGCMTLLSWPEADLGQVYMEQSRSLNTYLASDSAYGSFFPSSSLKNWVEDAHHLSSQLQMSSTLDDQSRQFIVYIVTRNLNEAGLFYSRVKLKFIFSVEGAASVHLDTTFSPMIDFTYGTNGHAWLFQDSLVWEILLLLLFSFFTCREIFQMVIYCRANKKRKAVQPDIMPSKGANTGGAQSSSPCSPRPTPPVLQIEKDKRDLNEDAELNDNEDMTEYAHSVPMLQIDADRNSAVAKNDEYRSILSQRSSLEKIDINNNGVDDLDELEALIEEAMPDKSVVANLLDWVTVAIVLALLLLREEYISTARGLHELFLSLEEDHSYSDHMTNIVSRFDSLDGIVASQRLLLMMVMFTGMTQFFRYLSFDSRLGIVAETVLHSAKDLLPVLFIFIIVLVGYSVLGASIFGPVVESWSTVGGSMLNLMIFIVGEYGTYMEIYETQPAITAIYFWSYMIVAYFIIFNMILAVIFNVYNKKSEALEEKNNLEGDSEARKETKENRKMK